MIVTLLLILFSVATLFLAGYGPTLLLLDRRDGRSRAIVIPVCGAACYIVATHLFASLKLTGGWISFLSPLLFAALVLAVPRKRRLDSGEIRESLGVFAICCGGLLLAVWPLLREGYRSYMAFGNADAAFSLGVFNSYLHHGYRDMHPHLAYWPNAQFAHVFGIGYVCILISLATGADIFKLHDVVSASLVFLIPASVFVFSVVCLKVSRGKALAASAVVAVSSQVCYTFYLQSLGAMTLVALLPLTLAVWAEALEAQKKRQVLCAALLLTGVSFGYYAALPIIVLLFSAAAVVAMTRGIVRFRQLCVWAALIAVVMALTFPSLAVAVVRRSVMEAGSSRLVASLAGPEEVLSFAFALTEQVLPFFWGVAIPTVGAGALFEPPAVGYLAVLLLGTILTGITLWFLVRPRTTVPAEVRAQLLVAVAVVVYYVLRDNSYGAFKLAAWFAPMFLPFVACILAGGGKPGKQRWRYGLRYALLAGAVACNAGWSLRLGTASLPDAGLAGKSMSGFAGEDFGGLRAVTQLVPANVPILVSLPDTVVQRWALTYLDRGQLSAIPYLSHSPNLPDAYEDTAAAGAKEARYLLTWSSGHSDIVSSPSLRPVWQNAAFQLLPMSGVHDFLTVGRGWYPMESITKSPELWQHRFRWLRSHGELLLLNATGETLRLRMTIVSGYGEPSPSRSISIALNGAQFDRVETSGIANITSAPFQAHGFLNRISLSLPDAAQPIPSNWGLFRRWVPKDGRRLNVAVSDIELLTEREYEATPVPCGLDFSRPDAWKTPGLNGLYADHWIAGEARVFLKPCGNARFVEVRGIIPDWPTVKPPFLVNLSVNSTRQSVRIKKPGPFTAIVPLPPPRQAGEPYEIAIDCPRAVVPAEAGLGADRRRLSIMVNTVELRNQP